MLTRPSRKLCLLAWIAGGTMSLFAAGNATAADCGCEIPCDGLPAAMTGCDCGCSQSHHSNAFSQGFHKLQDQFKKLCDLKWCDWKLGGHGGQMCDDACDAAMMDDLMLPPGAVYQNEYMHSPHVHPHAHSSPHPEMLPHVHVPPAAPTSIAPPIHVREKLLNSDLFEALPDPFTDDEAQLQTERSVRPSSHAEVVLRQIPARPLSRRQDTSSRRAKSVR